MKTYNYEQFTIKTLLERLNDLKRSKGGEFEIETITDPASYRGVYSSLAFCYYSPSKTTVDDTIKLVESCIGKTFEGYKGGDYVCGLSTLLHIASWGCCGPRFVGITNDGEIEASNDRFC